jgi:hypothetical protein
MERAVVAEEVGLAVLNLMSDNPGMRWDIESASGRRCGGRDEKHWSAMSTRRWTCVRWSSGWKEFFRSGAGNCPSLSRGQRLPPPGSLATPQGVEGCEIRVTSSRCWHWCPPDRSTDSLQKMHFVGSCAMRNTGFQ